MKIHGSKYQYFFIIIYIPLFIQKYTVTLNNVLSLLRLGKLCACRTAERKMRTCEKGREPVETVRETVEKGGGTVEKVGEL